MKNSQKGFLIPLIIIIVSALAIIGGVYYSHQKTASVSENSIVQNGSINTTITHNNIDSCVKLPSGDTKDRCYYALASGRNDFLWCSKTSSEKIKQNCEQAVAIARSATIRTSLVNIIAQAKIINHGSNFTTLCTKGEINTAADDTFGKMVGNIITARNVTTQTDAQIHCVATKTSFALSAVTQLPDITWCADTAGVFRKGELDMNLATCK